MAVSPQHDTLVAATVLTVTFDKPYDRVEVMNVDGEGEVFYRADGTNPAVGGNGSHMIPAVIASDEIAPKLVTLPDGSKVAQVKLISAGTPKVSVRGLNV